MTYASYLGAPVPPPTAAVDGSSPQSLMMFDISALQALYGANFDKLGTAERYSWDTDTGQQLINGEPRPHTGTTITDKISRRCGPRARPPPTTSATSSRTRSTTCGPAAG